ncbi:MAG TPA: hypothetical protein VIW67_23205, partial [Terriglobales bacterium]
NIDPSSANAAQANKEITAPNTHTSKNISGFGNGPAMSLAVRKIEEPIMPLANSKTESSSESPRISVGFVSGAVEVALIGYPIPSSSGDSNGVPQTRQMMAEQSPQISGSLTSRAHLGQ